MILIVLLALGLAAGLLGGGKVRGLGTLRMRHAWVPLLAFGLQTVFVLFVSEPASPPAWLRMVILVVTYGAAFGFLTLNRHLPGSRLLLAGAALNAAVMLANGGFMPVTREALARSGHSGYLFALGDDEFVRRSKDVVLDKEDMRLWYLSDVFGIPAPLPFASNFSPGDLLIGVGAAWLVYRSLTCAGNVGQGDPRVPRQCTSRRLSVQGDEEKESGHGVRGDAEDDRPRPDRSAVSGRPVAQSAGGHT